MPRLPTPSLAALALGDACALPRGAMLDTLELFGIGSSWGGYESLAIRADIKAYRTATKWNPGGPLIRLHIGLEDPDDLIADLERGLARLKASA